MNPVDAVLRFVERINVKDTEGIAALMTDDHCFVDSMGIEVSSRGKMRLGWEEYFRMVPDYRIEVQETFAAGAVVVLLGKACGTYSRDGSLKPEDRWETPAAWRAVVDGNRLAAWQVYADNEPIRRRIAAAGD